MNRSTSRLFAPAAALALIAAACSGGASPEPTAVATPQPTPEMTVVVTPEPTAMPTEGDHGDARIVEAAAATIDVDGDATDWAAIEGLDLTLEAIMGEGVESKDAHVKVAYDEQFLYLLFEVEDDYDWVADDPHLSGSAAVMWQIDPGAGEHMGADEPDRETSLGMVDLWHWELECAAGDENGGAVSGPGDGNDPGNDAACNLDDEWATVPDRREDDNGTGAENSILGVWSHTNPTAGAAGSWIFELRRPLQTGDEQDGQFAAGEELHLALAYWDPDQAADGWADDGHVQSSNQGWIEVHLD